MKLTFLGAAHEVTGSLTLIEVGGRYGIVDCGMEQGEDIFVNQELPVEASRIDFVLLTHAHIDHSGNLPLLYKNGFRGAIHANEATCHLCEIMLRDCAHIQESDAVWKSRKAIRAGGEAVEPLYTMEDVEGTLRLFHPHPYGARVEIAPEVEAVFTDAGHLLGSASISVWLTEGELTRKVIFSGDIGNLDQPIINDPQYLEAADYVVTESTYGDRSHPATRLDAPAFLAERIQRTLDRGGNLLIPAFAVGRAQEILYFIREIKLRGLVQGHDDFPVYLDSPLATAATSILLQCDRECFDPEMLALLDAGVNPLMFPGFRISDTGEDSKRINEDPVPKVIISASGMCEAGRIRHHLKHNLWRPESMVLFVGYQAVGTTGRALVDGAKHVKLFGEEIAVHAEIDFMPGNSGHADREGLFRWIESFREKPSFVFINHGDDACCLTYEQRLCEAGYKAYAPYSGTCFDLAEGAFTDVPEGIPVVKKPRETQRDSDFEAVLAACERLTATARACKDIPNKELRRFAEQLEKLETKWQSWAKR